MRAQGVHGQDSPPAATPEFVEWSEADMLDGHVDITLLGKTTRIPIGPIDQATEAGKGDNDGIFVGVDLLPIARIQGANADASDDQSATAGDADGKVSLARVVLLPDRLDPVAAPKGLIAIQKWSPKLDVTRPRTESRTAEPPPERQRDHLRTPMMIRAIA